MTPTAVRRARRWQSLSTAAKQERLTQLRRHQQREVELDLRLLRQLR